VGIKDYKKVKKQSNSRKRKAAMRQENLASTTHRGAFGLFFLAFWGFFGWLLFFSPALEVSQIEVVGKEGAELSADTQKSLENKGGEFLQNQAEDFLGRNFLFFSAVKLEDQLAEQFKILKDIRVEKQFPKSLKIVAEEREQFITWCQGRYNEEDCFLVDEEGVVFYRLEEAPELAREVQARVLEEVMGEGEDVEPGAKLLDPSTLELILEVAATKGRYEWKTNFLKTPSRVAEQLEVETEAGWKAYFSTKQEAGQQLAVLEKVLTEEVGLENLGRLEYVDLRVSGRAVYRLQEE